jgi:hypothetical protein
VSGGVCYLAKTGAVDLCQWSTSSITLHTRISSTLKMLGRWKLERPAPPKEVSIWFGHTFRKSHCIANPPDFYAAEE